MVPCRSPRSRELARALPFVALVAVLSSCLGPSARLRYSVSLHAEPDVQAQHLRVEYPGFGGYLRECGHGETFIYMTVTAPLPYTARCTWQSSDGTSFEALVPVRTVIPPSFRRSRDGLRFVLTPDNKILLYVLLRPVQYAENLQLVHSQAGTSIPRRNE